MAVLIFVEHVMLSSIKISLSGVLFMRTCVNGRGWPKGSIDEALQ
jgi:hypothetical protein